MALYALDSANKVIDVSPMNLQPGQAFGVQPAEGLKGYFNQSLFFSGSALSFVTFPHMQSLDFGQSFNILLWVYPESSGGPLFYYGTNSSGIQVWITRQKLTTVLLPGASTSKYIEGPNVILKSWNFVAMSYDYNMGEFRISHFHVAYNETIRKTRVGAMKFNRQGKLQLAATPYEKSYFKGRLACLQIYENSLSDDETRIFRKRCLLKEGELVFPFERC